MVLSRDNFILYPAISITYSYDLCSVHVILIILQMYHSSATSSLLSFVSVQHSHPCSGMDHKYAGFQSVDFGAKSDISVGKD